VNDFVAPETVPPGELDEFPGPGQHRTALRRAYHRDTAAAPELEQALFPEQVKRSQDGVLVHSEHRREVLGQRQALAGHGFARGGAFSPDGTTLALFARLDNRDAARLMLVDLATGSARVAREPQLAVGAGIGWAQWVPDGRRLVMGPASTGGGYLVDTVTLSAEPLVVVRGHGRDRTSNQDPNYTTVLIPSPR
jgi:hypothetical protein